MSEEDDRRVKMEDSDAVGNNNPVAAAAAAKQEETDCSLELRPVFLGNLRTAYSTEDVISIFERPPSAKHDPIPVDRIDLKRGYCFVFLKDAISQAQKDKAERYVSEMNGMNIPHVSNSLRAEFARGDGKVKRKEDERRKNIEPSDTLFVVNFHEETTRREDLQMLFEPFGELVRIDMKRNYAFIQFRTIPQAQKAKETTNGGKLDQSVLTVEYVARQRADRDGGGGGRDRGRRGGAPMRGGGGGGGGDRRGGDRDRRYDDRDGGRGGGDDRGGDRGGGGGDRHRRDRSPYRPRRSSRSRSRSPPPPPPRGAGGYRDRSPPRGGGRYNDDNRYDDYPAHGSGGGGGGPRGGGGGGMDRGNDRGMDTSRGGGARGPSLPDDRYRDRRGGSPDETPPHRGGDRAIDRDRGYPRP